MLTHIVRALGLSLALSTQAQPPYIGKPVGSHYDSTHQVIIRAFFRDGKVTQAAYKDCNGDGLLETQSAYARKVDGKVYLEGVKVNISWKEIPSYAPSCAKGMPS